MYIFCIPKLDISNLFFSAKYLIDSFKRKGIVERESIKIFGKKEKIGDIQLRYIEDIHVMAIFLAC